VFDGPEDYHAKIDDPALGITPRDIRFARGRAGGLPGRRRGGQHATPAYLIKQGITALPCTETAGSRERPGRLRFSMPRPRLRLRELSRCCALETGANRFAQRQRECLLPAAELDARHAALSAAAATNTRCHKTPAGAATPRGKDPWYGAIIEVRRRPRRSIKRSVYPGITIKSYLCAQGDSVR